MELSWAEMVRLAGCGASERVGVCRCVCRCVLGLLGWGVGMGVRAGAVGVAWTGVYEGGVHMLPGRGQGVPKGCVSDSFTVPTGLVADKASRHLAIWCLSSSPCV